MITEIQIIYFIGYAVVFCTMMSLLLFMIWILYQGYDYWIKKLIGWNDKNVRSDLFYFIKHKEKMVKYKDIHKIELENERIIAIALILGMILGALWLFLNQQLYNLG